MQHRRVTAFVQVVAFAAGIVWLFPTAPLAGQASDDTVQVNLQIDGTVDFTRRSSDDFAMTREDWHIQSTYTQKSIFTVIREPSGRIGGAPTAMFGMVAQRSELFEPTMSPFDAIDRQITGSLLISTCAGRTTRTLDLSKRPTEFNAAGTRVTQQTIDMGNRGAFLFAQCGKDPDKVLAFYEPPVNMFMTPPTPPVVCNGDYTYTLDAGMTAAYDSSVLGGSSSAALKRDCPDGAASRTEDMIYLGSVSWRALKGGASPRLAVEYSGSDGNQSALDEQYTAERLRLSLQITPK